MIRYITAAIIATSNCVGMWNVVRFASSGREYAAWWLAAACTLGWVAVVLMVTSAALLSQRSRQAGPGSSADRAASS
jgi:dolichyl-phosphate-mannose--protein O-mannosyl transferase